MKGKKLNKGSSGQNRKASEGFLEKYARKSGVVALPSGLYMRELEKGDGLQPQITDTVVVNQRILTVDGKVIADTYQAGMPDRFALKEAILGIQEGLQLAQVGGRYEFAVPPELAWGKRGVGNKIGPNAVLFFDLRLLEVVFS